ncbi:MFS transporter [Lentzea sp. NBRC 102530]|uniref:MFS transporter n=1 Tax=Lentzea sp. NBRC 102530 TaxID=3032201 RepID=UPI0024A4B5FE|nr:MFS transporter [Lentzea sp. NBRC 102530]GLY51467.1 hypothetical protein Lesp01_51230 [Lentzea sp. NBRC 102530]
MTGSLPATGLTLAFEYLPPLLSGPVAGVLADRWDRRRVMIAADLFRAGAVLLMLAVAADHRWIYAALVAESAGAVLFRLAAQAHVPSIVGVGTGLSGANFVNAVTDGVVRLVGPPLGAAILALTSFQTLVLWWRSSSARRCWCSGVFLVLALDVGRAGERFVLHGGGLVRSWREHRTVALWTDVADAVDLGEKTLLAKALGVDVRCRITLVGGRRVTAGPFVDGAGSLIQRLLEATA